MKAWRKLRNLDTIQRLEAENTELKEKIHQIESLSFIDKDLLSAINRLEYLHDGILKSYLLQIHSSAASCLEFINQDRNMINDFQLLVEKIHKSKTKAA